MGSLRPTPDTLRIGPRLCDFIAARGHTGNSAALASGIATINVYRILNGVVKNPHILTVARIVHAVGGTMAELFSTEESPWPAVPTARNSSPTANPTSTT